MNNHRKILKGEKSGPFFLTYQNKILTFQNFILNSQNNDFFSNWIVPLYFGLAKKNLNLTKYFFGISIFFEILKFQFFFEILKFNFFFLKFLNFEHLSDLSWLNVLVTFAKIEMVVIWPQLELSEIEFWNFSQLKAKSILFALYSWQMIC